MSGNDRNTQESYCGPYFYKKDSALEKETIRVMMKRPGMYVGALRMDYFRHFLYGFTLNSKLDNGWSIVFDLEKWLFVNESASIRHAASINSWSLFFRCFGVRSLAVSAFRIFLQSDELTEKFELEDTPAWKIYRALNKRREEIENRGCDFSNEEKMNKLTNQILSLIDFPVSEIKVYMQFSYYFMQLRFYFRQNNQWIDGVTLQEKDCYYEELLELHACAEALFGEEGIEDTLTFNYNGGGISLSCDISYVSKYDHKEISEPEMYDDEECFYNKLYKWQDDLGKFALNQINFKISVDLVNWFKYNGPEYYKPEELANTLSLLVDIDTVEPSSTRIVLTDNSVVLKDSTTYNVLLLAIGNNQAGSYYPAIIETIDFIIQVALKSNNPISRNTAINVLIDLFHFCPVSDLGYYNAHSVDTIKSIVNQKITSIKPKLLTLLEWDIENRNIIMDLVETVSVEE